MLLYIFVFSSLHLLISNSNIKNSDYDEIAKLVSDYEEKLISEKKQEYEHNQELLVNANLEHWIRPSKNEQPQGFKKVEEGCYW